MTERQRAVGGGGECINLELPNNILRTRWLIAIEMSFLAVLEATSPKTRWILSCLATSGSSRHSLAWDITTPISASFVTRPSFLCLCVRVSPLHIRTPLNGLRADPTPVSPYLNQLPCNNVISKQGHVLRCWG